MSREIKFRCWNTAAKLMYPNEHFALTMDGLELQLMPECEHYDKPYLPSPGNMIYMQYTGLKDKNGKEIYEGDIVRFSFKHGDVVRFVEWSYPYSGWAMGGHKYTPEECEVFGEVIGNIYENPELLK
jgi:uncharacterized phage protein (TIGR01671 family)